VTPSTIPEVTPTVPARPPRPAYDPWRNAHGVSTPPQCRIEQITIDKIHGALPSRLHQQGQILGHGLTRLIVRCDHKHDPVTLRPHLVRVLTTPSGY
jgi:hypothetical protein